MTPTPPAIFCPACDALILNAARCPACQWERPAPPAGRGAELWRAALPAPLVSGLTLAGGALYGCDETGKFHALSAETGHPLWPPVDLGAWRVHRRVAAAGDRVLLAAYDVELIARADKAVIALDAATGREAWRAPTAARHLSDPAVMGDLVVVGTNDGRGLAFDLAAGAPRWAVPLPGRCQAAPAVTP